MRLIFGLLACGAGLVASTGARGAVIADLRGDYDTPSSPHTDGQTAAGRIPDAANQGSWTFFARSTAAPGGTETALVYSTTANGVRNANAYVHTPGTINLPAISNSQLIVGGTEGAPASDELALHPGNTSQSFLVVRWTPGAGQLGTTTLTGAVRDLGLVVDGITFQIFNAAGNSLFGSQTTSGNTPISFSFDTTTTAGSYIDFVVGPNGNFNSDQSALKISIIPEPMSLGVLSVAACGLLWRRRARHWSA